MEKSPESSKFHRPRRPGYNRLDSFVGMFLGPADRSGLGTPVVHRHDAAEDQCDRDVASFEIEVDSEGHHYAVRRPTDKS
ncbi:hypothetical protein ACX80W_07920 [Arthrobacter sp. TMN-37]